MKKLLLKSFIVTASLGLSIGVGLSLADSNIKQAKAEDYWTVTFDPNGGTVTDPDNFEYEVQVTKGESIAELPFEGIDFGDDRVLNGWATAPKGTMKYMAGDSYTPEEDITLYAHSRSYSEPDIIELSSLPEISDYYNTEYQRDTQYRLTGVVTGWYGDNTDGTDYGYFYIGESKESSNTYLVYGANADNECVWNEETSLYEFSNDGTFLNHDLTKIIRIGSEVTMLVTYFDKDESFAFEGCVEEVVNGSSEVEDITADINGETEISFVAGASETYTVDVEIIPNDAEHQGYSVSHYDGEYLVNFPEDSLEATDGIGSFEITTITDAGSGTETLEIASTWKSEDVKTYLTFTAESDELVSVRYEGTLTNTQYAHSAFNSAGLTFYGTYSSTNEEVLSSDDFTFSSLDEAGTNITVTATHTSSGLTCNIEHVEVLENDLDVFLTGNLDQPLFYQTQSWNHEGLVPSGTYANGDIYEGEYEWSYSPASPSLLEVGTGREVTITVTAVGTDSSDSKTYTVDIEKCLDTYELDGKTARIKGGSYYLAYDVDETKPASPSIIKADALLVTFEIVGDNTFKIKSGDYYLSVDPYYTNDGLRLNDEEDTWLVSSSVTDKYTLTNVESGRTLTQHGNSWKTYTSVSQGTKDLDFVFETVIPNTIVVSGTYDKVYYLNQDFDETGMIVDVRFSDNSVQGVPLYECDIEEKTFTTLGEQTIKVSTKYFGVPLSTTITVNVLEDTISSYSILYYPTVTTYHVGDTELDLTGLQVQSNYASGKTEEVTSGITAEGFDTTQASDELTITIKVNGEYAGEYNIVVKLNPYKTALHIKQEAKNVFFVGDDFSYEGLVVEANMSEGEPEELTESEYDVIPEADWNLTPGTKTVTISYKGNDLPLDDITYPIYVNEKPKVKTLDHISLSGNYKTDYFVGESFTYDGLIVTAHYVNDDFPSDVLDIDDVEVSTPDMTSVGSKTVTVSYTFGEVTKQATYEISVSALPKVVEKIEIISNPTKVEFNVGDNFTANGIEIKVTYTDETTLVITDSSEEFAHVSFSGYNMNESGTQTVTVSYQEKTATYQITINEVTPTPTPKKKGLSGVIIATIVVVSLLVVSAGVLIIVKVIRR